MLCAVYKSLKKEDTYLYLPGRDRFERLPETLKNLLGPLKLVMLFDLRNKTDLALADINKVQKMLLEQGYYLQLPPPPENYLEQNRQLLKRQG